MRPSIPGGHHPPGERAASGVPPASTLRLQKSSQVGKAGGKGRCRCFLGIVKQVDQQNRKWQRAETVCVISSLITSHMLCWASEESSPQKTGAWCGQYSAKLLAALDLLCVLTRASDLPCGSLSVLGALVACPFNSTFIEHYSRPSIILTLWEPQKRKTHHPCTQWPVESFLNQHF